MKKYHILVPEYVPLSNKGEEAIVRGIGDALFPEKNCEIHLFDIGAVKYRFHDGIHVYPGTWFFSDWVMREFGLGLSWEKISDSFCSLFRHALDQVYPNWVKKTPAPLLHSTAILKSLKQGQVPHNEMEIRLQQLLGCDFVIAGHDGGLDHWVCHIIRIMREQFSKAYGVFGVQLRNQFGSQAIMQVHAEEFRHARFFYCRDAKTAEGIKQNFPFITHKIIPDPAFAMQPAASEAIDRLIYDEELERLFQKPVVMCTSCEPSPIARHSFDHVLNPDAKLRMHRELFAKLIRHVSEKHNVNVLFLPHALGPGHALDDREVARAILKLADLPQDRVRLLENEYGARELKGLISRADFLIAERIHSIIGTTGVATPFMCLGSKKDTRITGIVEQMLGMSEAVYYLNTPVVKDLTHKFDLLWETRLELKERLETKRHALLKELAEASSNIHRAFNCR